MVCGVRKSVSSYLLTGLSHFLRTWPVSEQIIDLAHKALFAATTGYVADRLILGRSLNAW